MEQPPGFKRTENTELVCKLNKSIYSLKQPPRVWFENSKATFIRLGYNATKSNNSLFTKFSDTIMMYILVYVDDFIITGNNNEEIM